ncbi:MerR family transcriptional regulator [Demequina sp. NBRC 110051]|uniref:transcriptional regulator FtsR n=1 Tax=Demequina sp. NBRC 110051 TaxID=1570340 RepID=UPI001F428AB3|nr:MerR family transcriptional regulator [Demequina sp. NBRC 110051]
MAALRAAAPAPEGAPAAPLEGTWPHALSHEPLLRVSDVLGLVQSEFPALTPSKLRFLDSNGLVTPHRTPSGYRQYSPADVERVRFVLRQQRDHYRPLSVIASHLEALDEGRMHEAIAPHAVADQDVYVDHGDLARAASVEPSVVSLLEAEGVIAQAVPGRFDRAVVPLVVACGAYLAAGGATRELGLLGRAVSREADAAVTAGRADRHRGDDKAADEAVGARLDAAVALFSAWLHAEVDR